MCQEDYAYPVSKLAKLTLLSSWDTTGHHGIGVISCLESGSEDLFSSGTSKN